MKKLNKKMLNVMTTAALVASIATPAFAATDNRVDEVPNLADDAENKPLGTLSLKEDDDYKNDLKAGTSFTVTFPNGVKLQNDDAEIVKFNGDYLDADHVEIIGDYTINVTVPDAVYNNNAVDEFEITPFVDIDGFEGGDITATVESFGSGVTPGKYTLGTVSSGDTTTSVLDRKTLGEGGGKAGTIRITENAVGAIGDDAQEIRLRLPKDMSWNVSSTAVSFLGGLSTTAVTSKDTSDSDGRTLVVKFNPADDRGQRGVIQIATNIDVDSDADYGDITVEVSGSEVDDEDVVIGTYSDFGVSVKADDDEIAEIISGRLAREDGADDEITVDQIDMSDDDNHKLTGLKFKENVKGSLIDNRKTKVEFPSWVKIIGVKVSDTKNVDKDDLVEAIEKDIDGEDNVVEFTIPTDKDNKVEFVAEFLVSVKADASGDIVAKVTGRQGVEGEVTVGKAIAPVTATGESKNVKVGLKGQSIGDIIITEGKDGAFIENKTVTIELEDGEWTSTPKIEVIEGNLEIDEDSIDTDGEFLTFDIDSESTKASKIKISGSEIDLYRHVPEGAIFAKVKGSALVQNSKGDVLGAGEFDASNAAKVEIAKVVTPAPGESTAEATFTLGSTTYTVDGVEKTADVAAYAEGGRTYLPIRYVADALGVTESNILYDKATSTVTLIKDGLVAQMTIGSNILKINGANIAMDAKAQLKDNRTVLPLRYAAQALGASVSFDEATKVVTVKK